MKMIKFLIAVSLLCSLNVQALDGKDIDTIIDEVRQEYNDSILVIKVCNVIYDKYEDLTPTDFAILYNYMTSCKDEEGSEGIYDRITWDLVYSNNFFHSVSSYLLEVRKSNKYELFYRWLYKEIIWFRFFECSDCEDYDNSASVDSVTTDIIHHLPSELFKEVYKSDTTTIKNIVVEIIKDLTIAKGH